MQDVDEETLFEPEEVLHGRALLLRILGCFVICEGILLLGSFSVLRDREELTAIGLPIAVSALFAFLMLQGLQWARIGLALSLIWAAIWLKWALLASPDVSVLVLQFSSITGWLYFGIAAFVIFSRRIGAYLDFRASGGELPTSSTEPNSAPNVSQEIDPPLAEPSASEECCPWCEELMRPDEDGHCPLCARPV